MSRTVNCQKLNQELPGLTFLPYPGDLGKKIYEQISQQAWQQWLKHQTMLINEKRLSLADQAAREYLASEMEKFLFGGDYEKPEGYIPLKND
ncbi:MAG: oxidative damage protection protein [Gammaproteobacteria bacterium CG22_combo_CG10-13_8_21_14_all_40_8]|nr:MAG: oxidative damage protection protein [Gammaproteobacteria bacterium CG22_combo_CG10-13_8_21_14_all_40_8]